MAKPGGFYVPPVGGLMTPDRRRVAVREEMTARVAAEAPRVPWNVLMRDHLNWKGGEHVAIIGPTGQGKTTLMMNLLPLHPYVTVFATKPRDSSMDALIASGYVKLEQWENIPAKRAPRRVLWPNAMRIDSAVTQKAVFKDAMAKIYIETGWTLVIDEGYVIANDLGLKREVMTYLLQARSLGISLVFATQRPAWVPLEVYDQSTHLFFYRESDERNLERLSGINWVSAHVIRHAIANLEDYQFLYINTRTGKMARSRVPYALASKGG